MLGAMPVPVERNRFATRLCESLGTRGVALEGRVFLAPGADAAVLRHELAHIAQQRLWRGHAVPAAWTEAEAHAVAAGRLPRARLPLDPRIPACWEEVGHYYTVYYVLFAVGVRDPLARSIAFYTQLPDEVSDLDAARAGFAMPGQVGGGIGAWIYDHTLGPAEDAFISVNNGFAAMLPYGMGMAPMRERDRNFENFARGLQVQRGLHSLTGASAEHETRHRTEILRRIDPVRATLDYGLALHAFGDSFAHREADGAHMYPSMIGHGAASQIARSTRDEHIPEMTVHPDAVGPHHAEIYLRYVAALHALFLETIQPGSRIGTPMPVATVTANLRTIISTSNAAADSDGEHARQIEAIRQMAGQGDLPGMDAYDPENQTDVPIDSFVPRHTDITISRAQVRQALARAAEWSNG